MSGVESMAGPSDDWPAPPLAKRLKAACVNPGEREHVDAVAESREHCGEEGQRGE